MFKMTVFIALTFVWNITVHSQELLIEGDQRILINDEALETLWEEGGFTEGAAAGPDGNMYFSDFAQPFESGPARVMRFNPSTDKTNVFCPDSGMGNGLMFTRGGDLMGCCASPLKGHRALVNFLPDGKVKIQRKKTQFSERYRHFERGGYLFHGSKICRPGRTRIG
jgi:hypothetical protein